MSPDSYTIKEFYVPVDNGHKLYVQDWGNQNARTIFLFLHGGPGSGCSDSHKQYFDGSAQRVIFFDQRGAGKSTPTGSLKGNDTDHLVADIDVILDKLDVKQAVIVGGSWGSTLGLAYALKRPKRVKAMVLRGIFTGSQAEIDFLDKGGFRAFFPEVWEAFVSRTPKEFQDNPAAYHSARVLGDNKKAMKASAYAYSELEIAIIKLDDRHSEQDIKEFDPLATRIEVLYMHERCFLPDRYILNNAQKLKMPIFLVQGRYDAVCPPVTAHELHQLLPNSQLIWTNAGHSGSDRSNYEVIKTLVSSLT